MRQAVGCPNQLAVTAGDQVAVGALARNGGSGSQPASDWNREDSGGIVERMYQPDSVLAHITGQGECAAGSARRSKRINGKMGDGNACTLELPARFRVGPETPHVRFKLSAVERLCDFPHLPLAPACRQRAS